MHDGVHARRAGASTSSPPTPSEQRPPPRARDDAARGRMSFPAEHDVVDRPPRVDAAACWTTRTPRPTSCGSCSTRSGFDRPVRRVVVMVSGPSVAAPSGRTQYFTFRPGPAGSASRSSIAGMHPMMAKRLELWRLRNFYVDRLPSVEDVYLFHGVARDNPKDERLFALAEVRDVTAVRDGSGRLVQIPHLERMLMETMTAIRREQLRRPPGESPAVEPRAALRPAAARAPEGRARGDRAAPRRRGRGARPAEGRRARATSRTRAGELRDTVLRVAVGGRPGHGAAVQPAVGRADPAARPSTRRRSCACASAA